MRFLYQITIQLAAFLLPVSRFFSSKMKLFVNGRRTVFQALRENIDPDSPYIWIHVASLGEYEQGLPVMEGLKKEFPGYKLILTFFSPSGFEIRKNNKVADTTVYLPLDTLSNARRFLNLVQPKMAFFIKYEFWPNYLNELKKRNIPVFLISGIFRKNQLFFKGYGSFYRKSLRSFTHFFVQNQTSEQLLHQLGFKNITVHGDTRFDRVAQLLERIQPLPYISQFKNDKFTVVVGSSWIDDENAYLPCLNASENIKWIIAPHTIKEDDIVRLQNRIVKPSIRYSNYTADQLAAADVFIIDTIGLLTQIYAYADVAYVGGGFKTGLHNILEPATYGIPVIIGPEYKKFQEARDLVAIGSCLVVHNNGEFTAALNGLVANDTLRHTLGKKNKAFVEQNKNATRKVIDFVKKLL